MPLRAVGRRHVVIDNGQGLFRMAHLAARQAQAFESLRARHLMDEMAVDIEQAGAVIGLDGRRDRPRSCHRGCGAWPCLFSEMRLFPGYVARSARDVKCRPPGPGTGRACVAGRSGDEVERRQDIAEGEARCEGHSVQLYRAIGVGDENIAIGAGAQPPQATGVQVGGLEGVGIA